MAFVVIYKNIVGYIFAFISLIKYLLKRLVLLVLIISIIGTFLLPLYAQKPPFIHRTSGSVHKIRQIKGGYPHLYTKKESSDPALQVAEPELPACTLRDSNPGQID